MNRKIIFDEGPFGNHAQYNGDVTFLHGNFSCQNATLVKNGEIWFNKTSFQNVPANGLTIAAWVFADSTTFSQSLFPLGILGKYCFSWFFLKTFCFLLKKGICSKG